MIEHTYIHTPFCIRKCKYCSFVSGFDLKYKDLYVNSLINEIKQRYKNERQKTIYFGGGTPSLLEVNDFEQILSALNYNENSCEITLEVNPETVEIQKFQNLKNLGFNRISLGIQTFNNAILKEIGRLHNTDLIYNSLEIIKDSGFKNISIDLMYGLSNQTLDLVKTDLKKAIELDINHISTYGLKIEDNSFYGRVALPQNLPTEENQAEMFLYLCDFLTENGFNHYEISNFAKAGFESQHNNAYWLNKNYYGFGLAASGFENNVRYKNTANFKDYLENPLIKEEEDILCEKENMENEIFLALRLKNGVNIELLNKKYNINFEEKYKYIIKKYVELGLLEVKNNQCKLTKDGILLSNTIMSDFID